MVLLALTRDRSRKRAAIMVTVTIG
jgi:hypothetical protein